MQKKSKETEEEFMYDVGSPSSPVIQPQPKIINVCFLFFLLMESTCSYFHFPFSVRLMSEYRPLKRM